MSNVLEVDFEAMKMSLLGSRGALILFDFQAASPSLAHDYLWSALDALGVPHPLLQALQCFYVDNVHIIKVKGQQFPSIKAESGIRQGCPLSPLLFAVVVDILLRRLANVFPGDLARAFADDIAMVVRDFDKVADILMREFREFAYISGLKLGMPKTVVIPLWRFTHHTFMSFLRDTHPEWSQAQVTQYSKYLGIMVGPGKSSRSWDAPLNKFDSRVPAWSSLPVGLFRNAQNYNIFVFSCLMFVAQIEDIPEVAWEAERKALRKFSPGPGNWVQNRDLFHLKSLFGLPASLKSLGITALAAKLRVLAFEAPEAEDKVNELRVLLLEYIVPPLPREWYDRCHYKGLFDARNTAASFGVTRQSIFSALTTKAPTEQPERSLYIRALYQREAYD